MGILKCVDKVLRIGYHSTKIAICSTLMFLGTLSVLGGIACTSARTIKEKKLLESFSASPEYVELQEKHEMKIQDLLQDIENVEKRHELEELTNYEKEELINNLNKEINKLKESGKIEDLIRESNDPEIIKALKTIDKLSTAAVYLFPMSALIGACKFVCAMAGDSVFELLADEINDSIEEMKY